MYNEKFHVVYGDKCLGYSTFVHVQALLESHFMDSNFNPDIPALKIVNAALVRIG